MPTSTINITGSVGGLTMQGVVSRTAEGQISHEVSLPAADAGELTTRTNDTDGELTMDDANHGISTGDVIDIFWTDGSGNLKCAYGATVGTVSGQSVPFTGASGDALPTVNTDVTADVVVEVNTDFDGDDVEEIMVLSTRQGHFDFLDSTPASLHEALLEANQPWFWFSAMGYANPLTGNPVDKLRLANADANYSATVKLGVLYDSVQ